MTKTIRRPRPITDKQREVLAYIKLFRERFNLSPTYDEIAVFFEFASRSGAKRHVDALTIKGAITRIPGKGRTIVITEKGKEVLTA